MVRCPEEGRHLNVDLYRCGSSTKKRARAEGRRRRGGCQTREPATGLLKYLGELARAAGFLRGGERPVLSRRRAATPKIHIPRRVRSAVMRPSGRGGRRLAVPGRAGRRRPRWRGDRHRRTADRPASARGRRRIGPGVGRGLGPSPSVQSTAQRRAASSGGCARCPAKRTGAASPRGPLTGSLRDSAIVFLIDPSDVDVMDQMLWTTAPC